MSPRPAIAPRKSRTALEQIVEILTVDMNGDFKRIFIFRGFASTLTQSAIAALTGNWLIRPVPQRDNPFGPFVGSIAA